MSQTGKMQHKIQARFLFFVVARARQILGLLLLLLVLVLLLLPVLPCLVEVHSL